MRIRNVFGMWISIVSIGMATCSKPPPPKVKPAPEVTLKRCGKNTHAPTRKEPAADEAAAFLDETTCAGEKPAVAKPPNR